MDPLSDVLSLLKPRSYSAGGFGVEGDLSIQFPRYEGIKCYAMVSGQAWLVMENVLEPVRLNQGDCFLLPQGRSFCLTSDLTLKPIDYREFLSAMRSGTILSRGAGERCFIAGGHFALSGDAGFLLGVLPPIVHIRRESDKAAMRWSLDRMREELRDPQPGGFLVAQQLACMMLVQALRLHLAEGPQGGVGWLFALANPQIGAAIAAMHEEPARRWTLQTLAERAGMSRSIFALKFKATVGSSPMEYLTRWRMMLAGDRLTHSQESISAIALALGYESESAFGKAFKKAMGSSPRSYGKGRTPVPARRETAPAGRLELVAG